MDTNLKAQKILKQLNFDFATFTLDGFLQAVGDATGREIITIPWEMPSTLFGAWISDGDEPREYIFYRKNISQTHQIHVQLHELSHFLFGHATLHVTRKTIGEVIAGTASMPFSKLPQLRSPKSGELEVEAETLASLIQKHAIQNSKIGQLIYDISPEEKLANFLKTMSA